VNLVEALGFESSTLEIFKDTSSVHETSRVVMEYWRFKEELSVEDGLLFK